MAVNSEVFNQAVEKIYINDSTGLQELIKTHNFPIDAEDEYGMTLLQHAAFKGKKDPCQLLLDLGADPNGGHHEHNYSSLHFAALSGNVEICQMLLQQGCRPDALNSVGRTAPQMAAFVGNHQCVSVINNFIPREEVENYTVASNSKGEPKLPPAVAPALHKLIMQVNLNPIHLLFTMQKLPLLWDNLAKVTAVLKSLSENQMKRNHEANEILSLKFHYLSFLTNWLAIEQQKHSDKALADLMTLFAKGFLKRRASDGFPEFMDNFVRESIRTFAHKDTTVFRQLLVNLSKTKQEADAPLALSLLTSSVNGQRGFQDDDACATCGQEKVSNKCSSCKSVQYCNRDCQKMHWPLHKKDCDLLAKRMQELRVQVAAAD